LVKIILEKKCWGQNFKGQKENIGQQKSDEMSANLEDDFNQIQPANDSHNK